MVNWKKKLRGFLHDPPSKALDIGNHEQLAATLLRQAGFNEQEADLFSRQADWTAAAADRMPFPKGQISCQFDGVQNAFHHPLGRRTTAPAASHITGAASEEIAMLRFARPFTTSDVAQETEQAVQPKLQEFGGGADFDFPGSDWWRAQFFAHWRLYQKHATEHDYRFAFLPADTRLPDHTIWAHMQVVSALAGCVPGDDPSATPQPAFLKFQLGPVQDFIAQARSIRDLWSGSYLLSWLMAAGLKALSELAGPDAVIYPNLRNQPLFDLHWREALWGKAAVGQGSIDVWKSLNWGNEDLLTPNLPNVFLAVVPASQAGEIARAVENGIREEWQKIAEYVWSECKETGMLDATNSEGGDPAWRHDRFRRQIRQFLSISWQTVPWPKTLEEVKLLADRFEKGMPVREAWKNVEAVIRAATIAMPASHRDHRFYTGGDKRPEEVLNNVGLGWAVMYALTTWALDATRQTRDFAAANTGGWQVGTLNNKDALNGRDEAVAGGRRWAECAKDNNGWGTLFKHDDWVGAVTLVKRLWHKAYLARAPWNLPTGFKEMPMPNTRSIAAHEPYGRDDDARSDDQQESDASEKYLAVIAFDGDEIGKWVSGEKAPRFASQLADYVDAANGQRRGALEYFENSEDPDGKGPLARRFAEFLSAQRPLSPSYHLQFSEALSNFARLCAGPVVGVFNGRLIYAGGDDVLAVLPANTALACAKALRMAFQGDPGLREFLKKHACQLRRTMSAERSQAGDLGTERIGLACDGTLLNCPASGFVERLDPEAKPHRRYADQNGHPIPFLVPGPAADASVGIAIGHFKAPIQDMVRAAQAAEKRAKTRLGRGAVAVSLMKRSGEMIEWGCKWDSGGLEACNQLLESLQAGVVSEKFPHRLVELLEPYLARAEQSTVSGLPRSVEAFTALVDEIVAREILHVTDRQKGKKHPASESDVLAARDLLTRYCKHIQTPEQKLTGLIGLCEVAAFANRTSSEEAAE